MTDRAWARRMAALIRQPLFIASVTVVTLALIAGGLAWQAGRHDGSALATPSPTDGAPSSWASFLPAGSPEPLPSEPTAAVATLTASAAPGPVVPTDTGFDLASVDSTPASVLAARLTVEPALSLAIAPDAGDRVAHLTPATPLQAGAVYRFALHGPTGELLDSWAFQASQPLRIVGTLPEGESTDVPVDTGIELTFDQDGAIDVASHVTITPATTGRFEQHGRTIAFVPDKPLRPATIYKVVVSPGVTVASSGEGTAEATRFQFETAATSEPSATASLEFQDVLLESATADRPIVGLWSFDDGDAGPPKTTRIEVFELADMPAAIDAYRLLRTRPTWSRWSEDGLIDTTKLHRVVNADLTLETSRGAYWIRLPDRLPAGWYLLQDPGGSRPIQAVLQVTDVAGYLALSTTRTLVWANDLASGAPIVGATVAVDAPTAAALGRTDTHGLLNAPTPASLLPDPTSVCTAPCEPVVTIRTADDRAVFMSTSQEPDKYESYNGAYYYSDADPGYWSLLHTDRNHYRSGDTVNLWGVVQARATGTVPATVTVRLTAYAYDDAVRPPVASVELTPSATGAFIHSMPLAGLSDGYYDVELVVAGKTIASSQFLVGPLAKPAYRLDVVTGRRVYIAGDRIKVSVGASFFEGTPVPGVPIRITADMASQLDHVATTDATGTAVYRTTASVAPDQEGMQETIFSAAPARAEEGEIGDASRETIIFPSSRTIDVSTTISGGRVRVTGGVHLVDVARLEAEIAAGRSPWELDPRGKAVGGATVTIRFYEQIPIRTQTGTEYDFIEKKVVPVYESRIVERAAGTIKIRTAAGGAFIGSIPATTKDHDYRVVASVSDPDHHTDRMTIYTERHPWTVDETPMPTLHATGVSADTANEYGIGDRVDVTLTDPTIKQSAGDGTRYLFMLAQGGIRAAAIQASPRYVTSFKAWAVPNMQIDAVRFTRDGYVGTVSLEPAFRQSDRALQIDLTADAARYVPGGRVTIGIRTRDAAGAPVAATVVLRAIDEKLYSIGAASADDPLAELYMSVGSGILGTVHTHRLPRGDTGGGDTTGGGGDDRDDFRDSLLFTTVDTDASGRGTVSFKLSDDLTSWRVSASGITKGLQAGSGSVLVPVGLPFFVDASLAPEYLVADRPSIPVRVYGSAVTATDPVTIRVTVPGLLFDSGPIRTTAFTSRDVPLPPLQLGRQTITIRATSGAGPTARTDAITRTFDVVSTRLTIPRSAYVELPAAGPFQGGTGRTKVLISNADAGSYLPMLADLAEGGGARLDRGLAAEVARSILARSFGSTDASDVGGTFDPTRYQGDDGGLALLPYSSSDLELSTLVALMAPEGVDRAHLGSYLREIRTATDETRERQTFALAGLAALGDPLIPALRLAAADPNLTDRERLMLGLGAAASGDAATARTIAATLIADHGERAGDQARLRVGTTSDDITEATALMAVLLADLGDHRAPAFWAYVADNPGVDRLDVLPAVAFVGHELERLPVTPAAFTYRIGGATTHVDLEPGRAFELDLTAAELATLTIEPITGTLGVTTTWQAPIAPTDVAADPDMTLARTSRPATVGSGDLVVVTLDVTFDAQAAAGCHQVTELVPSGLTPVGSLAVWPDTEDDGTSTFVDTVFPYDQSGPRVFFCAAPDPRYPTIHLRYVARVVTPGTYAWEPAIAASRSHAGQAAMTSAGTIVIH